jgi:hypothetical protein
MKKFLITMLLFITALPAIAGQGSNANKYGRALEKKIEVAFKDSGFTVMLESKYLKNKLKFNNFR